MHSRKEATVTISGLIVDRCGSCRDGTRVELNMVHLQSQKLGLPGANVVGTNMVDFDP